MGLVFAYDTYHLILLHIFSIFILLSVNFSIWLKAKKIPLLYAYLAVQGILLLWMTSKIFKTVAPNAHLKFIFVVCQYAGVVFLGVVFYIFAFLYAKGKLPTARTIVRMSILPLLLLLILVTNPYHLLFYSHFDFWGDSFGPAFYIQQGYSYLLIGAGILLCAGNFRKQFGERRIQSLLFSIAILIPLAANIIYVFGWFKPIFGFSPPCDITPITCNISLMLFALATFRYRFFDDIRIARRKALASVPEGILLTDAGMRIMDFNDTFKNLYESGCLYAKDGCGIIRRIADNPSLVPYEPAAFLTQQPEPGEQIYETENGCYYRVISRSVTHNGESIGFSLRFIDFTLKHAILTRMVSKNNEMATLHSKLNEQARMCRNLAKARTRNFIACEVHDILGHSIVLVISLLEVARLSFGKPGFELNGFLDRARGILRNTILGQPDAVTDCHSLIDRINRIVRDVGAASVDAELTISGTLPQLSQECENAIFKICREGITNAIRHGKAEKVDIIIRSLPENIEVYVIDNGIGCEKFCTGMGITGMQERLKALGGSLICGTLGNYGFSLQAEIPVRLDRF